MTLSAAVLPAASSFCSRGRYHVLGGVGLVVHQEELDVVDVADEERLVAGGHHVAGLLVGAIADLGVEIGCVSRRFSRFATRAPVARPNPPLSSAPVSLTRIFAPTETPKTATYRGHSKVALEPSPNTVVNTLGLAPCRVQALEPVALVAHEALGACKSACSLIFVS